jgi:type IV pilus assembly protein PilY1
MYYYQTDLRPGTCTLCTDNVFISSTDNNVQQHMTTFTLGLGASGWMNYSSSYLSDSTGDYVAVKLGSTASSSVCTWQSVGSVCTWPVPGMDGSSNGFIANIDDLWHAAVNGRGAYFSATNPASLASGLSNALAGINARKGSAAAAATSTLNPVAGNNFAYVASYTTVEWRGNLEARGINVDTGVVSENASWCIENVVATGCPTTPVSQTDGSTTIYNCETPDTVTCPGGVIGFSGDLTSGTTYCKVPVAMACTGTMNAKVSDATDTRTIKTANSAGTDLIDFDTAYATANPSYFNAAHIGTLSQWSLLDATQKTNAAGTNLLKYLRGQYGYEDRSSNSGSDRLYRYRSAVLGDALESQPAFISKPLFSYPYPGYSAYATAQASRAGTVYMGANDGMMHAFAADTGIERWAYVPSMVIPNMWKLADKNYATLHLNFVNGSPITSDVCVSNCADAGTAVWKTILVAGLNGGGRGYYALDITTPATPVLLWEFTPTTGIGKIQDDDVGYSFGQPIITRKADGTWVVLVSSGYNNTTPGDGKGYLYVLNAGTGAIISKIAAAAGGVVGDGLAKIAGRNDEPVGNTVGSIYGGDLAGNVWRFNINGSTAATIGTGDVMNFAILKDSTGVTQPITTAPVLGKIAGQNIVFVGTGKYLETADLTTTQRQTQYAIKDDNAVTTFVNPRSTLVQQTLTNNADGTATRTGSNNVVNFYTGRGWYFDFPDTGERVNIDSKLVQGTLLIPSLVPSNTACSPGGYGWLNFVDYKTGGAIETLVSQKYDATIVGVNVIYVQGQPKVGVVTSSNPTPVLDENVSFPASAAGFTGKRTLWRELTQ